MNVDPMKANLLLVDDQPQNLTALEAILEPLGQNLVRANSGNEALKHLLNNDFAAILLDVQMPDLDGFATAALIKERQRSRHIPILFLTALSKEKSYVAKGYSVGAVDYISKPFDPDILRSKVGVFVELSQKNELMKRQSLHLHEKREREVADFKKASEERYQTLAESMPQIVWKASASGELTYGNCRWFECAGIVPEHRRSDDSDLDVSAAAARRLDWEDVLHPDDIAPFLREWRAAIEERKDWESEYRFGSAAAGYRWHLVRAVATRDARGRVSSFIGTSTDIDDRRYAEEGLRLLAEASTQLSSSGDVDIALRSAARLAVPHLGTWCVIDVVDEGEALKRVAAEHCPTAVAEMPDTDIGAARVVASGKTETAADAMCVPLVVRGRAVGAMTLLTAELGWKYGPAHVRLAEDLARRCAAAVDSAQLHARAERERTKLENANRTKDEFLATVSHELRTPLNAMLGWAQILRAGRLDEASFNRALHTIERNAKTQAQLIADLLDVSRIVTGKLGVDFCDVQLVQIVEGAVEAARPVAASHNVALGVKIDADVGEVRGDPVRLQQVVGNLLSNAIKFTPAGGRVEIELRREVCGPADARRGQEQAVLQVRDSGQGIDAEFLPFVFERFRQADSSSTRARGGLGLGLAIVHHLVGVHDGKVTAESGGANQGSTFTVMLPLLDVAIEPRKEDDEPDAPDRLGPESSPLAGLHVLVVEDDPDGRDLLRALLEQRGAQVSTADAADTALDLLQTNVPDVLVSDIGLPGEDGYSLIGKVRALAPELGGKVPAIALTAYASAEDRRRAIAAGFQTHVAKPLEPALLSAAVARLAGRGGGGS